MAHRILQKEVQYRGKILELEEVLLELPTGKKSRYELVMHKPSVSIIPVDTEGFLYLVKQFRLGVPGELLEFPAGVIEGGEQPDQSAIRELREETGFTAKELIHLGNAYLIPGYGNELMYFFLARQLALDPLTPDIDENLEIVRIPIGEIYRLAEMGEIHDTKSLAALTLARQRLLSSKALK